MANRSDIYDHYLTSYHWDYNGKHINVNKGVCGQGSGFVHNMRPFIAYNPQMDKIDNPIMIDALKNTNISSYNATFLDPKTQKTKDLSFPVTIHQTEIASKGQTNDNKDTEVEPFPTETSYAVHFPNPSKPELPVDLIRKKISRKEPNRGYLFNSGHNILNGMPSKNLSFKQTKTNSQTVYQSDFTARPKNKDIQEGEWIGPQKRDHARTLNGGILAGPRALDDYTKKDDKIPAECSYEKTIGTETIGDRKISAFLHESTNPYQPPGSHKLPLGVSMYQNDYLGKTLDPGRGFDLTTKQTIPLGYSYTDAKGAI